MSKTCTSPKINVDSAGPSHGPKGDPTHIETTSERNILRSHLPAFERRAQDTQRKVKSQSLSTRHIQSDRPLSPFLLAPSVTNHRLGGVLPLRWHCVVGGAMAPLYIMLCYPCTHS